MYFEWLEDYSVNVKIIDEQHKMFLQTLNKLYDATLHFDGKEKIAEVFNELSEYIFFHFTTEEKYFDQFHYGDAIEHREEHRKFKEKIEEFKQKMPNSSEGYFDLIDFLENWLVNHIHDMDKKYVKCFNDHGLY